MTPEQSAAFVFANGVAAMAEIEAMKAENRQREIGEAYGREDFLAVIDQYGIHHNAVLSTFQEARDGQ